MSRFPTHPLRRAALVLTAGCLALAVLPGIALAQPDPAPPEEEQSEPAPAPAAPSLCPDGSVCAWPDRGYAGDITEIGDSNAAGCRELARPARSAINDSGRTAVFYASTGCVGGVVIGIEPGRKAPSFGEAMSVRLRAPGSAPAPAEAPAPAPADAPAAEPAP